MRPTHAPSQTGMARHGLSLGTVLATVAMAACSGSNSLTRAGAHDGAAGATAGGSGDSSADVNAGAGLGGADGLDAGNEADNYWSYDEPVQTDPWCAPEHEAGVERAACCNDTPCYGGCARHSPDGSIVCECGTVVGGCKNGSKCCTLASGCVAADVPCPEGH